MQARALLALRTDNKLAIREFQAQLDNNIHRPEAVKYGLALAHTRAGNYKQARAQLADLISSDPSQLSFHHADIELAIAQQQYPQALAKVNKLLRISPNNYPLIRLKTEALWQAHRYEQASDVLTDLSRMQTRGPYGLVSAGRGSRFGGEYFRSTSGPGRVLYSGGRL